MSNFFTEYKFQECFHSNFDEETGISIVTFNNKYGKFTGMAKLNPEDKPSAFIGQYIAEKRAVISYYKTLSKILEAKLDTIRMIKIQGVTNRLMNSLQKEIERKLEETKKLRKEEELSLRIYIDTKCMGKSE